METLGEKAVGSIIKIKVNGVSKDFIIVHQGLPSSKYDSSCNGTWLLMKDIYEQRVWDRSNNDYKNSDIRTYLNGTFLNLVDSNIKSAIKYATIPYVDGDGEDGTVLSGVNGLSAKIFLLGCHETGTGGISTMPVDGANLSYFDGEGSSKRITNYDGSAASWWLRSPYNGVTDQTWGVSASGSFVSMSCNKSYYGVRPAFILPSTLNVDSNGNIVFNTAPTITGSSSSGSNLGEISAPFNLAYTVNDADNDPVTVTEYLDNTLQRSYTATLGAENTFQAASDPGQFQKILNGTHTIKVVATDSAGNSSSAYTVTFNKQVKTATITLTEPLPADDVIKAAVISIMGNIPQDATLEILVTNNALDDAPVWEDMTQDYLKKINHLFSNKTAANGFAFNFKVTATRGASGEQGFISNIGGAFE